MTLHAARISRSILFFTIIFLYTAGSVNAQKAKVFSGDTTTYIEELTNYMSNLPEQYEDVLEEFITSWEEDSLFNPTEQYNIIKLSVLMIKRKTRPLARFARAHRERRENQALCAIVKNGLGEALQGKNE